MGLSTSAIRYTSRDFVCYSHICAYCLLTAADLLTPRTEGLTLSVQVWLFRLVAGYTYAPAAEVRGIRAISHDAVLSTLMYRSRLTMKYGEPRCSSSSSTNRCSSSHKRDRNSRRCSSCRQTATAKIPLHLPPESLGGFIFLSYLLRAKIAWGIEPQDDLRSPASKHYEFISYFSVASAVLVTFLTLP